MNLDEYNEKIKHIEKQADLDKFKAAKEYALSNSTVEINDVIDDHIGKVMVNKIKIYRSSPPQCVYEGVECKKDGTPTKRVKTRGVYQSNMKPNAKLRCASRDSGEASH
jgi:hypothetical protein